MSVRSTEVCKGKTAVERPVHYKFSVCNHCLRSMRGAPNPEPLQLERARCSSLPLERRSRLPGINSPTPWSSFLMAHAPPSLFRIEKTALTPLKRGPCPPSKEITRLRQLVLIDNLPLAAPLVRIGVPHPTKCPSTLKFRISPTFDNGENLASEDRGELVSVSRVAGCDEEVGVGGVVVDQPVAGRCVCVPVYQYLQLLGLNVKSAGRYSYSWYGLVARYEALSLTS